MHRFFLCRLFLALLTVLSLAAGVRAYTYDVAPVPATASLKPLSSTALAAAGAQPGRVYLEPFMDRRRVRTIWQGEGKWDGLSVDAKGLDAQPKAWASWDYASLSFLWQRQLGQALDQAGYAAQEAPRPGLSSELETNAAAALGVPWLLGGEIRTLSMDKRGADRVFSTNFSGTFYGFFLDLRVRVGDVKGRHILEKPWTYRTDFFDPTHGGRPDGDTFPVYFVQGLAQAAQAFARDPDLRAALGFSAPAEAYWVNPKTGKRVDPSWNFDPSDGTPRKDFVLYRPSAAQAAPSLTPTRPSATPALTPPLLPGGRL